MLRAVANLSGWTINTLTFKVTIFFWAIVFIWSSSCLANCLTISLLIKCYASTCILILIVINPVHIAVILLDVYLPSSFWVHLYLWRLFFEAKLLIDVLLRISIIITKFTDDLALNFWLINLIQIKALLARGLKDLLYFVSYFLLVLCLWFGTQK